MRQRNRQTVVILGLTVLLLIVWSGLLRLLPSRATLAESNFQANLIRLQRSLSSTSKPPAALIGSSITGRILPEYFEGTPLAGSVNLGLDGSGPALALEMVDRMKAPPSLLLIEANLLPVPPSANDTELRKTVDGWWFKLASRVDVLRAESRPSSLLYS